MVLTPCLCFASSVCFGSFKNSFLIDPWSSILLFHESLSRRGRLGKLKLPLLDMLFDLIMSLARSRLCWCLAKRWSWLLPSCCGVCGATIKFTQAFVSFSRLHKKSDLIRCKVSLENYYIDTHLVQPEEYFCWQSTHWWPASLHFVWWSDLIPCFHPSPAFWQHIKWPMVGSFVTVP